MFLYRGGERLASLALRLNAAECSFSHRLFVQLWMAIIKILWLLLGMINNVSLFVTSLPDSLLIKERWECGNGRVCTCLAVCFYQPWASQYVCECVDMIVCECGPLLSLTLTYVLSFSLPLFVSLILSLSLSLRSLFSFYDTLCHSLSINVQFNLKG